MDKIIWINKLGIMSSDLVSCSRAPAVAELRVLIRVPPTRRYPTIRDPMTLDDLAPIPLFTDVARDALAAALRRLSPRTFLQDECLLKSGDPATGLFIILRGNVGVELDGSFLVPRGEYELIGEQALLAEDGRRTATVTARSLVSALWIPRDAFELLLKDQQFAVNLARVLSVKLTQATKDRAYRYSKEALVFGEFRAHVAPEVLDRLIQDGTEYGAPRRIEAIILFSDIRDFTKRSNEMTPEQIARDLTKYLNHAVDLVHEHGGMVDKFVGDALMAVWGAFENLRPEHAQQAFDCARRMVESAGRFRFGEGPIRIGVGLNAGKVFIGNVGGNAKRQFTVLGSAVNLASRFEAQTKDFRVPIVLGTDMVRLLGPNIRRMLREHPAVQIDGATAPQHLFTFDPHEGVIERSAPNGLGHRT